MAQRPLIASLFAFVVAATAVKVASGPPGGPSLGNAGSGMESARKTGARQGKGQISWADQLKQDPHGAGKAFALQQLQEKICGFATTPEGACPKAEETAATQIPMIPQPPEVMIAIGPDPVETNLALLFDRLIDGFEDAIQDSGWEYQGSWMPWPSQGNGEPEGTEFEDREQERMFVEGREQMPGVLLFRQADRRLTATRTSPQRGPLIVLVVGDSPTSGVNTSQFREAVRMFGALAPEGMPLKIMGPDFTGAGPSMRALLTEAKSTFRAPRTITVASGTVGDWRCDHMLPGVETVPAGGDDCGVGPDTFVSFGASLDAETQDIERFLMERGDLHAGEIALLTEDESGFGSLNRHFPVHRKREAKGAQGASDVLQLTFPRGISRLRSAYQKSAIWGFGGSSGAGSVNLSLDFDEPHRASDSVPNFALRQMPVSQEGSMGQVSTILEEHNIKAVFLSATDVLDELFVAQLLARRAPNVMVIVRGTDVLFLRSGGAGIAHTVYAVSPWPLIPKNYTWSKSPRLQPLIRAFPSGDAEGIYTATRYLMGERPEQLQDYSSPLRPTDRPPLWLSVIGQGAYWPVALIDSNASAEAAATSSINLPPRHQRGPPATLKGETIPISQRLAILVAVLLSLIHAGKCLGWPMLQRIAPRYQVIEGKTRVLKLVIQLTVTVLGCFMLSLVYEPAESQPGEHLWQWLFLATLGLLSAAGAWVLWKLLPTYEPGQRPFRGGLREVAGQIGLALLLFGGAYLLWHVMWARLPGHDPNGEGLRDFFLYRSQHPLSGASPVFPLLIALNGVTLFLIGHLGRLNFSPRLTPRLPEDVAGVPNCPTESSVQQVNDLLVWPLPGTTLRDKLTFLRGKFALFAIVAVSCAVLGAAMRLAPETLESRTLQGLLRTAMLLVVIAICWDLTMAAVIWGRLKVLCLDPLESSSLRGGFSSISGLTWKSLWLVPQSSAAQYRALLRALEQAMRRVLRVPATRTHNGESLRDAAELMWYQLRSGASMHDVVESFGDVQYRAAKVAEALIESLKGAWEQETVRITAIDASEGKEPARAGAERDATSSSAQAKQIAEEWVALIYIHYIRMVLMQIRTRLSTAAVLYLLLVWSVTSYPFLNRHALIISLSVLLGILAFVVTSTYASINRDPILSRTTENEPGKLDVDFYLKTASMVGIPLLGFVASQFPEVSSFLFSWIEPGMAAVK